ncbi:PREDICTED: DNA (cytosine-5)-methyltransferase DRM2 isoform X2 [Nelumbo nucifera]|uniref:DNA (Cytosine-5)-methyltransferase DRM2 isoform X2 n=1 Tax=Nelumbo nucifera TaxID=4432 RepID=A0A1U8B533_NELNU|nr:PREDICTED: DNA (cytosine-5)-methyltransferase DRM2 isoform X2 [Nelumbo nucifera]
MDKSVDDANNEKSSNQEGAGTTSKVVTLSLDLSSGSACSKHVQEGQPSSSGSNLRAYFIGMGFSPTLIDNVIEEHGQGDVDLLLETLLANTTHKKSSSASSDSLDAMLNHCTDEVNSPGITSESCEIEELDVTTEVSEDKKASLLMMNFSVDEVQFAIDRLGEGAPMNELVDFIIAAQVAGGSGRDTGDPTSGHDGNNEEITTEALFGTMDKTLRLLEMGFSEHEISSAIEKFGSDIPIWELADSIFANQIAESGVGKDEDLSTYNSMHCSHTENEGNSLGSSMEERVKRRSSESPIRETGASSSNVVPPIKDMSFETNLKGKKPKHEYVDDSTDFFCPSRPEAKGVEPKINSYQMPLPKRELHQFAEPLDRLETPQLSKPNPCRSLCQMVARPPYFFYGNVVDVSQDSWTKISQFLYGIEPEFVNTQFFSALSRKEGYIHNLPTDNRFHILPRSPMTIEDALPHTKKWWPSWDTRKQLSCISSEIEGIPEQCERLGKMLLDSQGMVSVEQQRHILHHCKTLNLVWVGQYKLRTIEPDQLERILGYPLHHTQLAECGLMERLGTLKRCFQTDTLGYHLSVLKRIFPHGLTMLSLYSGIGGAEVAFYRLGVRLKGVVSVEESMVNRKVLKKWWHNSGQTGELVQIENIQRLTSAKIESLIKQFGGFDLVICQNPCTSGSSKVAADGINFSGLDFPQFYEFVRVLQRVRNTMGRNR